MCGLKSFELNIWRKKLLFIAARLKSLIFCFNLVETIFLSATFNITIVSQKYWVKPFPQYKQPDYRIQTFKLAYLRVRRPPIHISVSKIWQLVLAMKARCDPDAAILKHDWLLQLESSYVSSSFVISLLVLWHCSSRSSARSWNSLSKKWKYVKKSGEIMIIHHRLNICFSMSARMQAQIFHEWVRVLEQNFTPDALPDITPVLAGDLAFYLTWLECLALSISISNAQTIEIFPSPSIFRQTYGQKMLQITYLAYSRISLATWACKSSSSDSRAILLYNLNATNACNNETITHLYSNQ